MKCHICGKPARKQSRKKKDGSIAYHRFCRKHAKMMWEGKSYALHKKDKCERCGFVPEHDCQLDVDHINGDHSDNRPKNLQTLCANCHRLKTLENKDYKIEIEIIRDDTQLKLKI
jgi:5-methylcytosine-specific restriction endonuclease McrA